MFNIFLILLIFSSFWLPYCCINYPNFLIHNFSYSLFIFSFFQFQPNFTFKNVELYGIQNAPKYPLPRCHAYQHDAKSSTEFCYALKRPVSENFLFSVPGNGLKSLLEEVDLANLQPAWWQLNQKLLRLCWKMFHFDIFFKKSYHLPLLLKKIEI